MKATLRSLKSSFLLAAVSLAVAGASRGEAQVAPLYTIDDPRFAMLSEPIEHHVDSWINLYTKSLFGFTYSTGPVTIAYDESYASMTGYHLGNAAGSFDLLDFTFSSGRVVNIPVINGFGLKLGALRYRLSDSYTTTEGDSFMMLEKSGAFLIRQIAQTPAGETHEIVDTIHSIVYRLAPATSYPWILRPISARFADGLKVEFVWNDSLFTADRHTLQRLRLMRDTNELERAEFSWLTSGGVTRVESIRTFIGASEATWLRADFIYTSTPRLPSFLLSEVRVGSTSGGTITGIKLQYGVNAGGKDILTGLQNYQGKQLFSFLTQQLPIGPSGEQRTVYSGFRAGPASVQPVQFNYQPHSLFEDRSIVISSPRSPQDPTTVRLSALTGALLEVRTASCPAPRYLVTLVQSGPFAGMVDEEVMRDRCDQPLTRRFQYNEDGTVRSIDEIAMNGQGALETQTVQYEFASITQPNGVKKALSRRAASPEGVGVEYSYTDEGRTESVRTLVDNLSTFFEYTYWDSERTRVRSITSHYANGRSDRAEYDQNGYIQRTTFAYGDPQLEASSTIHYDNFRRMSSINDERGAVEQFQYYPDGRLRKSTLTAADNSAAVSTEITYQASFPFEMASMTTTRREGSSSVQSVTTQNFHPDLPLVQSVDRTSASGSFRALDLQYNPATLQVTRDCLFKDSASTAGCSTFSYHPSSAGLKQGLLDTVSYGGTLAAGGFQEQQLYNANAEIIGTRTSDQVSARTSHSLFDGFGRLTSTIENQGQGALERRFDIAYNQHGKIESQRSWAGATLLSDVSISYDSAGMGPRPSEFSDSVSGSLLQIDYYDSAKRPTSIRRSVRGLEESRVDIASYDYDAFDRPTRISSAADGTGYGQGVQVFDNRGDLVAEQDIFGNTTSYQYDSLGRMLFLQTPLSEVAFSYRVSGGRYEVTHESEFRTSASGLRFPKSVVYGSDALDRLTRVHDQTFGDIAQLSYNNRSFNDQIIFSHSDDSAIDTWRFTLDGRGRQTERFLNNALVDREILSGRGMLLASYDSRGIATSFSYDGLDRLVRTDFPDSTRMQVQSFQFFYPLLPNGAQRRVVMSDRGNATMTAEYSPTSELLLASNSGGTYGASTTTFSYFGTRLTDIVRSDRDGWASVHYDYDGAGLPSYESHSIQSGFKSYDLWRSYGPRGALLSHIYPDSAWSYVWYGRDSFDRVNQVWLNGDLVAVMHFDGPVLTGIDLGDVQRRLNYDPATGLLSNITDTRGGQSLVDADINYDGRERIASRSDRGIRRGALSATSETFTYNSVNMLGTYAYTMPVFGTRTFAYNVSVDGILAGLPYSVDGLFRMPSRFSYDLYGNPVSESSANRTFQWNRSGIRRLGDPARGWQTEFSLDALGRPALLEKQYWHYDRERSEVRDSGMVLYQNEVTR